MAIDYFSRKVWTKLIKRKTAKNAIKFIKYVLQNINIKRITSDNGREFNNELFKEFCKHKNIDLEYSVPYFHQSNGRVERVNKTIRQALKHKKSIGQKELNEVTNNYNNSFHRGIGMSPDNAFKIENEEKVIANQSKYSREFKSRKYKNNFNIEDKVLLRNETKTGKMQKEFKAKGIIKEKIGNNCFKIKTENENEVIRHQSQIKPFVKGM